MAVVVNKNARLGALFLSLAFGIIAAVMGLRAIIRSHEDQDHIKVLAQPAVADIDVSQITNVGIVASVVNLLIAIISAGSLLLTLVPSLGALANKTLPAQIGALSFFLVFEIAAMIPYLVFFNNDSAKVTATLGGQPVPEALIKAMQQRMGISGKYKDLDYLKLLAIFPWINVAVTIVTVAVLFKAWSAVKATPTTASSSTSEIKESLEKNEKVEA